MKALFVFIIAALLTSPAGARATAFSHECGNDAVDGFTYSWCIDRDTDHSNEDLLYVFHGVGGSAETWFEEPQGRQINGEIKHRAGRIPTAISISFGRSWLVTELASSEDRHSLQATILNRIMPELEKRAGAKENPRRLIIGTSMGGFNAAQLSLKTEGIFDRAVLICPVMLPVGPGSTEEEIQAAQDRQSSVIYPPSFRSAVNWMRSTFKAGTEWDHHNPLELVHSVSNDTPAIYLTCGEQDEYGFFEGATRFAEIASQKPIDFKWRPMQGRHCVWDAREIAEFLYP